MEYEYKTLEEKFVKLPTEIQEALSSVEVAKSVKDIATKFELNIDQTSVLYDQVSFVMLGLVRGDDFVSNFSKETGLSTEVSQNIVKEINEKILVNIRSLMRESMKNTPPQTPVPTNAISSIERAGNFTIEKDDRVEKIAINKPPMLTTDKVNLMEKTPTVEPPANLPTSDPYREPIK